MFSQIIHWPAGGHSIRRSIGASLNQMDWYHQGGFSFKIMNRGLEESVCRTLDLVSSSLQDISKLDPLVSVMMIILCIIWSMVADE